MLLALILNDMVFDKYAYEEEDFMKNVGENGTFPINSSHHHTPRAQLNFQGNVDRHYQAHAKARSHSR